MNKFSSILWGLVLIILGVIIALNSLGIVSINLFFKGWWTLFIIIPCFIALFNKNESKTGSFIGLVIGIALLLSSRDLISFSIIAKLIFPFILVFIGLSIIFKDTINRKVNSRIKELNKENLKEYTATFSGQKVDYTNEVFDGASATAVFGGVDINICNAKITEDQVINATAIFGGIDIIVPKNVNVKVKSNCIFGGVDQKNILPIKDDQKTIYVNAFCLFGGVEIK